MIESARTSDKDQSKDVDKEASDINELHQIKNGSVDLVILLGFDQDLNSQVQKYRKHSY